MTNELLKKSPKAFSYLHDSFRMDFSKPYIYCQGEGKFTLKSLERLVETSTNEKFLRDYVVTLIVTEERSQQYHCAIIEGDFTSFSINTPNNVYKYDIYYFVTKNEFERTRKNYDKDYYIIAQKREYLTSFDTVKNQIDMLGRFKVIETSLYKSGNGVSYIGKLLLEDNKHKTIGYSVDLSLKTQNISKIIDKSGYLIIEQRKKLAERTKQIKADREYKEVYKIDYSDKIAQYSTKLEQTKKIIVDKLASTTNASSIYGISTAVHKLSKVYYDYRDLLSKLMEKRFRSVSAVEKEFARIDKKLIEIEEILQ